MIILYARHVSLRYATSMSQDDRIFKLRCDCPNRTGGMIDKKVRQTLQEQLNIIKAGIDHAEVTHDPFTFIDVRKRLYEFMTRLEGVIDNEIAKALAEVVVKEETSPLGEVLPRDEQLYRT
jgi:hypothetical protein